MSEATQVHRSFRFSPSISAVALAVALLGGCANDSPEALMTSAKNYLEQNDPRAAVIQLKNALQQKPESGEARFLLGKALLQNGEPVASAVELRKALQYKHPQDVVAPELARAMLAQGQLKAIVDQFGTVQLGDRRASADLKTTLAIAYAQQGRMSDARAAIAAALQDDADFVPARLLKARTVADTGDLDGALALVDAVLKQFPKEHDALLTKGDILLRGKGDQQAAAAVYRQAIEVKKDLLAAHAALIAIAASQHKLDVAWRQLEQLKGVQPNHFETRLLEGQLLAQKGEFKRAKEVTDQLLKLAPDEPRTLQLAGGLELQSGAVMQAEAYLNKALKQQPRMPVARKLLAQVYLKSAQPDRALETINHLLSDDRPDAEALALAAEARMQKGEHKTAEELYQRALKMMPGNARLNTARALTKLPEGKPDAVFNELRAIAASDPGNTADLALIGALTSHGKLDAAQKAIDALEKKEPEQPTAAVLRGRLQAALKDKAAARRSFERALQIDPRHFPAVGHLAALDVSEKRLDLAIKRFEDFLKLQPNHVPGMLALAELKGSDPVAKDEVTRLISEAIKIDPRDPAARLRLIEHHLRQREYPTALVAAQQAAAALPHHPQMIDVLGRAQLATQDTRQALSTFNRLMSLLPNSPLPHLRIADVQVALKNNDAALASLKRALAIAPDLLAAQQGVIALELAAGHTAASKAVARKVQSQRPDAAIGLLLEGDIDASQKRWDAAAEAYKAGIEKAVNATELAVRLHATLIASAKNADADAFAAKWTADHPKDAAFMIYLADRSMAKRDFAAAEARYRQVIAVKPDSAAALNNVAWCIVEQKKTGALPLAQKAVELQPRQPAFLDTLAAVLEHEGQFAKAIETEKQAIDLQPQNLGFKLRLAKLYLRAGEKSRARSELEALARSGDKFRGHAEVAELLKAM